MHANPNNLKSAFYLSQFSDLELILQDSEREISIKVNKIFLTTSFSEYFIKLLAYNKNKNQIKINVDDAFIAYDCIAFYFYGIRSNIGNLDEWIHFLKSQMCYDYFGFVTKINLPNIKIDVEKFELLFDISDNIENNLMVKLMNKYLPKNYKFPIMPVEKYNALLNAAFDKYFKIVFASFHGVDIYNIQKKKIHSFPSCSIKAVSNKSKSLVLAHRGSYCIYDVSGKNATKIEELEKNNNPSYKFVIFGDQIIISITYDQNIANVKWKVFRSNTIIHEHTYNYMANISFNKLCGNKLMYAIDEDIYIFDILVKTIVKIRIEGWEQIFMSPDGNMIINVEKKNGNDHINGPGYRIYIIDLVTRKFVCGIDENVDIFCDTFYVPTNNIFMYGLGNNIIIIDFEKKERKVLGYHNCIIKSLKCIVEHIWASIDVNFGIKIWNMQTLNLVHIMDFGSMGIQYYEITGFITNELLEKLLLI